jgi:beta-galactosidase
MTKSVGYEGRSFLIDGRRIFIYGGEMHYFRVPPEMWADRLLKMKRAFLNCVGAYVPWNWHEPDEGQFDFTGEKDLEQFINLSQEVGLYMFARHGPFICAEWDYGGLPAWLLATNCEVRSTEKRYIS